MKPSYRYNWDPYPAYTGNKLSFCLNALECRDIVHIIQDSKVHGANMGPTWVLSAPYGPHVGPMNLALRDDENGR